MKLIDEDDKEISEINMTPFVDIILVVLIIFMVAATFIVEGKIKLNLPKSTTAETGKTIKDKIEISIDKTGKIFLNGKQTTKQQLKEFLKTLKDKNTPVILRSDKDTKFQNVISIIDICREEGLENYIIETIK
ncbi:MAG: biopolymer transporter ExbD [Aquificae bacterium]|nr:biopolymer transporter ExbD [Aquificota bacterium]